eukprot:7652834-Alexandrium_andersonii.AAC.1
MEARFPRKVEGKLGGRQIRPQGGEAPQPGDPLGTEWLLVPGGPAACGTASSRLAQRARGRESSDLSW